MHKHLMLSCNCYVKNTISLVLHCFLGRWEQTSLLYETQMTNQRNNSTKVSGQLLDHWQKDKWVKSNCMAEKASPDELIPECCIPGAACRTEGSESLPRCCPRLHTWQGPSPNLVNSCTVIGWSRVGFVTTLDRPLQFHHAAVWRVHV